MADVLAGGREPPAGPRKPGTGLRVLLVAALVLVAVGTFWMHPRAPSDDHAAPGVTGAPTARASRPGRPGLDARLLVLGSVPRSYNLRTGRVSLLAGGPGTDPGSVQQAISLAGGDILLFARPGGGLLACGVRAGTPAAPLGAVTSAVAAGDGGTAWLVGLPEAAGRVVRAVQPDGSQAGPAYRLPAGTRLAGGNQTLTLTRGTGAAEQVLSWEPAAGSPRVLARGANVLAAGGGAVVLGTPAGDLQLLDLYGQQPRRIAVVLPVR